MASTAAALEPAARESSELQRLARALGSASWTERESAQSRLLDAGLAAVPFLEEASRSENVELAHRAQHLLSLIDPPLVEFRILKVELSSPARVLEVLTAELPEEGKETTTASGANSAPYTIRAGPASPGRWNLDVRQGPADSGQGNVWHIVGEPGAVSRVRSSVESLYQKNGLFLERRRHRYLTLIFFRQGRKSSLAGSPLASDPSGAQEDLERRLLAQAASESEIAKMEALHILAEIRIPKARGLLEGLVDEAAARSLACLGLDRPECLQEILAREIDDFDPADTTWQWQPSLRVRAALRLLELGSPKAVEHLLAELGRTADPFDQHLLRGALADRMLGSDIRVERDSLLDVVLSEEVLASALWEDPETEFFYFAAVSLLNPDSEKDIERGRAFSAALQDYLRAGVESTEPRARELFDIWCRAARKAPRGSVPPRTSLLIKMLEPITEAAAFSEVLSLIEESLLDRDSEESLPGAPGAALGPGQLADEELRSLLSVLEEKLCSADASLASRSTQWILRLSQSLAPRPGQLRRIVEALLAGADAPAWAVSAQAADPSLQAASGLRNFYLRQIEEQLVRWTGVAAASRDTSDDMTFDASRWKAWTRDDALVSAREKELLSAREAQARRDASSGLTPLVYYEFDILFKEDRASEASGEPAFEVMDGRRLEVKPHERIRYRDRWGNDLSLRVEPTTQLGKASTQRFRLGGKSTIFLGIPTLSTAPHGKDISAAWHEVSSFPFQPRALPRRQGTPSYRSLLFLAPLSEDQPPPPPGLEPSKAWETFVNRHLYSLPPNTPAQKTNAVLNLIRTLDLQGSLPFLRRIFRENPTFELARTLCQEGDDDALRFLLARLEAGALDQRVNAAMTLAQVGRAEGVRFLLESVRADAASLERYQIQILHALDVYLGSARPQDPARVLALDFLLSRIHEPVFQYRIFGIIKREAGQDFGFAAAGKAGDDEERKAAMSRATEAARAWWASERKKTVPDTPAAGKP